MLSEDVVRRLTVIASDTGLTTLKGKLDAVDNAQDRIAVSGVRMGRATEDAQKRIQAMTAQVGGMFSGLAGRSATEALATVGRIAPTALAAYAAYKLLNATVEQGIALLEKYGLAGQRALYDEGNGDALAKLMRFQGDTTSLPQQKYAAELSGRLDEANRKIKEFLKVQLDLTDPALKLMNAWVVIAEKIAISASYASKIPAPAASIGTPSLIGAIPYVGAGINAYRGFSNYLAEKPPPAPTAEEAFRIAQGRLGAGLAASGMIGKDQSAGFYGRFNAMADKPEKDEKEKAVSDEFSRYEKSLERQAAAMEAESRAVGASVGEHARLRAEMKLQETAMQDIAKNGGAMSDYEDRIKKISDRIGEATQKAAELKLQSDLGFERSQIGRTDSEASVAARLRPIYGDKYVDQMDSAVATQMRLNDQLKIGKDLATDFASGFAHDLRNGVKASEAFSNALGRIADKLLDMAARDLVAKAFGGAAGSGAGGLGGLFSPFFSGGSSTAGVVPGTEAMPGLMFHKGGVVGINGERRYVHPDHFDGADHFATGGITGIGPDEVPIVAHRDEEVLRRDDPRHRWNSGGGGGAKVEINMSPTFINADPRSEARMMAQMRQMKDEAVTESVKQVARVKSNNPNYLKRP